MRGQGSAGRDHTYLLIMLMGVNFPVNPVIDYYMEFYGVDSLQNPPVTPHVDFSTQSIFLFLIFILKYNHIECTRLIISVSTRPTQ